MLRVLLRVESPPIRQAKKSERRNPYIDIGAMWRSLYEEPHSKIRQNFKFFLPSNVTLNLGSRRKGSFEAFGDSSITLLHLSNK
ncbi:hypothetical protein TNCT_653541 [Trichonephila clavata]|uniref:Uncharacterized protein n=1 Tax=Trichonephila clavata TaxID=2740835 RepID=A0A8X6LEQ0_TRICU|nr:hypothetical protein TNCT_653541 [Trichonephila clavata]